MSAGYVYLLHDELGHTKIGYAKELVSRVLKVSPASPIPCELEASIYHNRASILERMLHRLFENFNSNGEWFKVSVENVLSRLGDVLKELDKLPPRPDDNALKKMVKAKQDPISKIIGIWPSMVAMAEDLGYDDFSGQLRIRQWKGRSSIPVEYWDGIIKAAERKGVSVSVMDLYEANVECLKIRRREGIVSK
jgi:hypothetical protein